jgi:integrase
MEDQTVVVTEGKMTGKRWTEVATSDVFWRYYYAYVSRYRKDIPGDFLFPAIGGDRITPTTVYLATRMCDRVLKKFKVRGVNLTPHLMRRSLATKIAGELSLKDAMRVTRHGSVQAFQKYLDMSEDKGSLERLKASNALNV